MKLFLFPFKHLHIHIYITLLQTMEIWKSHEVMDLYIRLSHFLQQYYTALLNQLIGSIISKYEFFLR